jgi:urease accessory protein
MIDSQPLLRLLQLASPALPIGAFAYSQSLEGAVAAGWVADEEGVRRWIVGLLQDVLAPLDLAVLARVHAACSAGDRITALRWCAVLHACRASAELEAEDHHLAVALGRVLDAQGMTEARAFVAEAGPALSYPALFALAARRWEIPARAAAAGFAFAWAEAQVGAALRLMPLGQSAGQRILSAVVAAVPAAVERALTLDDDEIGAAAPAHAIASAHHEAQYSRLFRS